MILLAAAVLLVLVVGVAVVVFAAGTASSDGDGDRGMGWGAAAIVVGVAAGVVVLFAVGLLGVDAGPSGEHVEDVVEVPSEPVSEDDDDEPVALQGAPATYEGRAAIDAGASPLRPVPVVEGLVSGDVVEVRAAGFLEHAEGVVAQCARADAAVCRNVVPIVTDGDGRALVPYRVETAPSGEVLVVEVDLARGTARLSFGRAPARAVISVREGTTVAIRGAEPGERVAVRRCDPDAASVGECEAVGRPTVVGADGTSSVPLGAAADAASLLVLTGADGLVIAEPVRVRAAPGAEVDLSPMQLLVGFGLAVLLLGTAVLLIRTTDWRVPAEAATPLLDAASLEA